MNQSETERLLELKRAILALPTPQRAELLARIRIRYRVERLADAPAAALGDLEQEMEGLK